MPDPRPTAARPAVLVAHPSADRYGSDRMLLESVHGLVEAGWAVTVTLPEGGPLVAELERCGATVVLCRAARISRAALRPRGGARLIQDVVAGAVSGWRLLRRLRPEVVYVSTVTVPGWLALARLARVPTVTHVHEAERSAPRAVRLLLALPLVLSTEVVANSRFAVETIGSALPRVAARVQVVPNGVVGPEGRSPARESLADSVRLVYVGRLSRRKGVDVAVRAVDVLRRRGTSATLDVVGAVFPGYEWFEEELRLLVTELGIDDRVRFLGFQEPVWPHVHAADVVLVPSRTDEPFGNTAVEAALCARPVVVSRSGGLVEAVDGLRAARVVPPDDAGAVAGAVEDLVVAWAQVREAVEEDAEVLSRRHAPELYRRRVADAVGAARRPAEGRVRAGRRRAEGTS